MLMKGIILSTVMVCVFALTGCLVEGVLANETYAGSAVTAGIPVNGLTTEQAAFGGIIPNVLAIDSPGAALQAAAFVFVLVGLHRAIFRSFLARELRWRWEARDRPRIQELQRLHAEITHGKEYQRDATHPGLQAQRELTDAEIETRRHRLEELSRVSLGQRALRYFANCPFCQSAWVALLVSLAAGCGWHALPNALGYAVIIALVLERGAAAAPRPHTQ